VFRVAHNIDLVYFHVAVDSKSATSGDHHIPKLLSQLLARLFQKHAEGRKESAHSVFANIEELLGRWIAGLNIDVLRFEPGQSDHRTRDILASYPFGRVQELETQLDRSFTICRISWQAELKRSSSH